MRRDSNAELPLFACDRPAGVDEAGRGPLAGPVVAAAVIFRSGAVPHGLADSKILLPGARERLAVEIRGVALGWAVAWALGGLPGARERLAVEIRGVALGWAVAWADPAEIDRLNILQASMLAMQRAVLRLGVRPDHVQVDGNCCPRLAHGLRCTVEAIVRGDAKIPAISAASILAKVARDAMMAAMETRYPGYGFDRHKGYPTPEHLRALAALGPSPIHRRSFRPVAASLGGRT